MKSLRIWIAAACAAGLSACAVYVPGHHGGVYAGIAPPPVRVETIGPSPGVGFVWTPGFWVWGGSAYSWTPGRWATPPAGYRSWNPGYWNHDHRGHYWTPGQWR